MKNIQKHLVLINLILCGGLALGQSTIATSGGDATGSGGTFSYSVGQLVYTTHTGNGSIIQGVQQSFELFPLSNTDLTTIQLTAITYPNPTSNYVVLEITNADLTNLSYSLYDLQGRSVSKGIVNQSNTQINMQRLPTGMYVLRVNRNSQELKTFKIIKK